METRRFFSLVALSVLMAAQTASAVVLDPDFTEEQFVMAEPKITAIEWAPDGSNRLFYTQQDGFVRIVADGALLPTPFVALPQTFLCGECGVLSLAFDPAFLDNGYVYVFVTVSNTEQQIIRFTANGNVGTNPTVIISGLPTRGRNHNGGATTFGPDGKLYWSVGDNGTGLGDDDDLTLLGAKVGRANPDGSAPGDNPFFDGAGPNNDYVWASGFRNPYTMTWSPTTERLWLNVVGTSMEQIFVVGAGDNGGWNNYESNQPAPFIAPVISYNTKGDGAVVIAADGAVRTGGIAAFTTTTAHRFRPGAQITVSDVTDASFNGTGFVQAMPTPTRFTMVQAGPDATSSGGTARFPVLGSCLTGGTFWDSNAVPVNRRGFYYGDYTGGILQRATLTASGNVTAVEAWINGRRGYVDSAVGPDGNLYYALIAGGIFRVLHQETAPRLVVSRLNVRMPEGSGAAFAVRLAAAPTRTMNVAVTPASGDVSVQSGGSFTFSAADWSTPKVVRLAAAQDDDSIDDLSSVTVSGSGLTSQKIVVRITDDDQLAILVSTTTLAVDEGSSESFQVMLSAPPAATTKVQLTRSSGDASVSASVAELTFGTNNWATPQSVSITAAEDDDVSGEVATFSIAASGLATRYVEVAVADNDDSAPAFLSEPVLSAVVGAVYSYDADASGHPLPLFSLTAAPPGMSVDPASGVVTWTPTAVATESVSLRAANGIAPDATQSFAIVVVADMPPSCSLTAPVAGDVLSGTIAEFYGDVDDDVAATGAGFWIDGDLVYEDIGPGGHYHFGGEHNLFDTTLFEDGEHVLAMTGTDTAGQTCSTEVSIVIDNAMSGSGGAGGDGAGGTGTGDSGAAGTSDGHEGGSGATLASAGDDAGGEPSAAAGSSDEGGAAGNDSGGQGTSPSSSSDSGCSCRTAGGASGHSTSPAWLAAGLLSLLVRRRSQLKRRAPTTRVQTAS